MKDRHWKESSSEGPANVHRAPSLDKGPRAIGSVTTAADVRCRRHTFQGITMPTIAMPPDSARRTMLSRPPTVKPVLSFVTNVCADCVQHERNAAEPNQSPHNSQPRIPAVAPAVRGQGNAS
jgi:hypothetical protein